MSPPRLVFACTEHDDCREHPELGVACWAASGGEQPVVRPHRLPLAVSMLKADYDEIVEVIGRQQRQIRALEDALNGALDQTQNAYAWSDVEPSTAAPTATVTHRRERLRAR